MNGTQQQILALSAVFEAGALADDIATHGECDTQALKHLLQSIMSLDADNIDEIYPEPRRLRDGLSLIKQSLKKESTTELRPLNYSLALLHLAAKLRKSDDVTAILRHRLLALSSQSAHFNEVTDPQFCHRLAGIYLDTLGTFRFRIRVHGEPTILQNEDTAATIRALFLAGVRAAFLWHQLGGRRWHLLFYRKRLLSAAESLNINAL